MEFKDLMPVYGPNSKQWYIYNEKNDVYIDPPSKVLEEVNNFSNDIDEQEEYLETIIASLPDWLYDEEYWYGENNDI